jgi:bifunctional DNA primase/polymerase-like protein
LLQKDLPEMKPKPEDLSVRALAYARRGWPLLPCQPGTKTPATRHGVHDASVDPDQLAYWWRRQPDANIAIATGLPGPDVLDVDDHGSAGSGFAAFNQLKRAGLLGGLGAIVATPNGGLHAYFAGSEQSCGRLPRQHLDFRSAGGYVLVPPSRVDGRLYRVVRSQTTGAVLDWSAARGVLEPERDAAARSGSGGLKDANRLVAWVGRLEQGNRNSGLYWAACRAIEAGQDQLLDELAVAAGRTGLSEREIAQTLSSARRSSPRQMQRQAECERT